MNRLILTASLVLSALTVRPAFAAPEVDANGRALVATCKDGKTYWHPTGEKRGACSGHGGVAKWADGSEVKSHAKKTEYK